MKAARSQYPSRTRAGVGVAQRLARRLHQLSLVGAVALLSGCADKRASFMTPDGPVAASQYHHLWLVTLLSLVVVLPVIVGVPLLAWRYRYSNAEARYSPHWEFSHVLEWSMWLVPAAIVTILSVYLWADPHKLDPYRVLATGQPPLRVEVVGLDWKWLFIYPEYHIATVGEMAFPQDRSVTMRLTTDTVMQSFIIPALGGQIYAMPGMVTQLNLKADQTGDFEGMNTQYNGNGFHAQHFRAVAMTTKDFNSWVEKVQQNGVALTSAGYRVLGERSTPVEVHKQFGDVAMPKGVTFFNNVAPDFFERRVMFYHSGKAVPADKQPGSTTFNVRLADK